MKTIEVSDLANVTGGRKVPKVSTFQKVLSGAGTAMNFGFNTLMAIELGGMVKDGAVGVYNWAKGKKPEQTPAPAGSQIQE